MKILMYSTRNYDKNSFRQALANEAYSSIEVEFVESALNEKTVDLARGYSAICVFVNDTVNRAVLEKLAEYKVNTVLCRCTGTDNVDMEAAKVLNIDVKNVPGYSPESVAEHAMTLLMSVNRRIHKAYNRIRDNNFSLTGLNGYCLHGKTVGIVGMGKIGRAFAEICFGLGMKVLAYDPYITTKYIASDRFDVLNLNIAEMVTLDELYARADVISLHLPLNKSTKHMINKDSIAKMKDGVILINVSRGGLIDTEALLDANGKGKFFGIGLDVYEGEKDNAFVNHEDDILKNNITAALVSQPNIIVTGHEAFLTDVALEQIAKITLDNCLM